MKSRSDKQLQSKKNAAHIRECKPMGETDNKDPIIPCGLIAWSLFNDTYGFSVKGKDLKVNKRDIAWGSDKNYKFGADVFPKNFQVGDVGGKSLNSSIPVSIYLLNYQSHACFMFGTLKFEKVMFQPIRVYSSYVMVFIVASLRIYGIFIILARANPKSLVLHLQVFFFFFFFTNS